MKVSEGNELPKELTMSPFKATTTTTIVLTFILTSGFGSPTFAKDIKVNSNSGNSATIQKSIKNIKTPSKETTPQQKCLRLPYC